ncbi:MAG TPA: TraB/GumN family protein [Sphingomicrobium sp.]|jgi:uncharacterized protein YbaP (TraB family)|nr:TraB/GumN family protein [Sphingomicrobium sp.]
MLFKVLKRAIAFLGLATAAYAAPATVTQTTAARPALWEVSDQDTTVYLFGTIHLLPDNYTWRTPAINKAITDSSSLYVETIVDPKDPKPLIAAMRSLGYSNGLPPLANRIDPAKRPLLEAAIAKSGLPRPIFDRMETWAAAFTLLGVQYREIGLGGENGPEQALRDAFGAAGKQVGQLETNAEQLGFFDVLPETAQRSLLEGAIEPASTATVDFSEMLRGWANGDVDAIARTFNHDLADSPALRQTLLDRRNANWSRWIEQRMAQPGVVFLAVGAGHLAGSDSVQSLLQRDGYKVRRIQ